VIQAHLTGNPGGDTIRGGSAVYISVGAIVLIVILILLVAFVF
jgi:hypothetical protein